MLENNFNTSLRSCRRRRNGTRSANACGRFPAELAPTFEAAERWVVERVQEQTQGNVTETARQLGVSRNRIYRILKDS